MINPFDEAEKIARRTAIVLLAVVFILCMVVM